jgi:hypothetical protein
MQNPTVIHSLAQADKKAGLIRFTDENGATHVFASVVNRLTETRLSWFDSDPPIISDTDAWASSIFKDIRRHAGEGRLIITEDIGDY